MVAISELFSLLGSPKSKLLILHAGAECSGSASRVCRSLISEHINAEELIAAERGRPTPVGAALRRTARGGTGAADAAELAVLRRWYFTRSTETGFALMGFPRTRRQALVFDEWLEARGENLDACLVPDAAAVSAEVLDHYRTRGLLVPVPAGFPGAVEHP